MKRRSVDREALANLTPGILRILTRGPQSAAAIGVELGVAGSTVRGRLSELQLEGRAHSVKDPSPKLGARFIWHIGPGKEGAAVTQSRKTIGAMYQVTLKTYPAENRRDPMVAALFGQPRQVAQVAA